MKADFEHVREILCEQMGVDEAEVTPMAHIVDDLGADSLDEVELIMAFEEAYGIDIPDDDMEKIRTVSDILDYLKRRTGKGAA
jgi:acyl carrier protein